MSRPFFPDRNYIVRITKVYVGAAIISGVIATIVFAAIALAQH